MCRYTIFLGSYMDIWHGMSYNHNLCMVCRQRREQMEDLSVEEIEAVHHRIMMAERGDCRILSEANLHQMVFRANLIPDCVPRAAFIFYSLCAYPAFREGNTETALAMTEQVLKSGGYRITGEKTRIVALTEGILAFTTEPEEIEQWFCDNVRESISR
jgi:prophage maintenance system killer protein